LPGAVSAQSTGNTGNRSTSNSSKKAPAQTSKTKKGKVAAVTTDSLNQRKEYQWENGQQATPTGNEATGINSQSAAPKKDTTVKKCASKKQE
jgi:hypothetical protein